MATTLYDFEVAVTSPAATKGISDESKNKLFKKPVVEKRKPKEAGSIPRGKLEPTAESETLSLEDLSQGYSELIERSESILDRLKERLAGLDYVFDTNEEPALAEAVGRVFQDSSNAITYKMYLAALRLDKDIAVKIGESESGFVK